jgi:hypothetical protein
MATSYRTAWTDWNVILTGLSDSTWASPVEASKAGPQIKIYGYLNPSWNEFNSALNNWVGSSLSQIAEDYSTFSIAAKPDSPVPSFELANTTYSVLSAPSGSAYPFLALQGMQDNAMDAYSEIKQLDSGDCLFTGSFNPQLSGLSDYPTGYSIISSESISAPTDSTGLAKTPVRFSIDTFAPSSSFKTSFSVPVSNIDLDLGWEHLISKTLYVSNLSGKSQEQTESLTC